MRRISFGVFLIVCILLAASYVAWADFAKGSIRLDGKIVEITYAEAILRENSDSLLLVFATMDPGRKIENIWDLRRMEAGRKGALVIEFDKISTKKLDWAGVSMDLDHESLKDGYVNEGLGTDSIDLVLKEYKPGKGGKIKGSLKRKQKTDLGHTWSADIAEFEVTIK